MAERILMKGNEAIAEAAIRAGCRHYFGYPITPQTEIAAYMAKKMPKIGGVFLQAESEIASINMVYGAAAAGMRVMTSSSSPGVSLKAEGLSYIAGSDVPALVVNVQRGGPGIWLWVMALLHNRKIRVVKNHIKTLTCVNIMEQLFKTNLYKENKLGGNDLKIKNLMRYYGQNIINKL